MPVYKDKNATKDGRSWYFRAYKKNGGQHSSERFMTKKEAKEAEALFLLKRDNPINKPFSLVANDYFDDLKKIRKGSTVNSYIKDYNNHIEPFFKNTSISSIGVEKVRDWAEWLENRNLSVAYMNKIHNVLNKIFDFAIKNYNFSNNPSRIFGTFQEKNDKVIKDSEKLRYITLEEFNKFISIIDNSMWKAFFIFAYYTGCRRGEIQALNWNDIDFDNSEVIINKTLYEEEKGNVSITSTKNNLNRKIKMSKKLKECLIEYKKEITKYTDFEDNWFVFGNYRFLPKTTIARYKDYYFELSGVRRITMHEFRHSHVSLLINEYVKTSREKNMKIDTAKFFLMMSNRMGHTIQVMQETYMHLFPTIQDEIVDLLDNL